MKDLGIVGKDYLMTKDKDYFKDHDYYDMVGIETDLYFLEQSTHLTEEEYKEAIYRYQLVLGWIKNNVISKLMKENRTLRDENNTKIELMKEMTEVQGRDGNWNCDPYMQGLYNGMEFILSIAEGRDPEFREAPKRWLCLNARINSFLTPTINKIESFLNKFTNQKEVECIPTKTTK